MPKYIPVRSGLVNVLFWSVISAAFIGPGTVTTAAAAGAQYKLNLLWTLAYATLACIVLQEAAARITIASGYSLGEAVARQYGRSAHQGIVKSVIAGIIVFGCAAYQAGNILGAVSGFRVLLPLSSAIATTAIATLCALFLWLGSYRILASFLGIIVGVMGFVFIAMAWQLDFPLRQILLSALVPSIPAGSSLLIIGLIGTTIVPYNLFLASGIGQGQRIAEMRTGITLAVLIGGLISMAILIVGSAVTQSFTYEALIQTIAGIAGEWTMYLVGIGLLAAGFSSAITAPLAAAITVQSVRTGSVDPQAHHSWQYRIVWIGVMAVGFGFGIADIRPIPVIIVAQGINGILLPLVAIVLLLAVNDSRIMPHQYLNKALSNGLLLLIVGTTTLLGLTNLARAIAASLGRPITDETQLLPHLIIVSGLTTAVIAYVIIRRRRISS